MTSPLSGPRLAELPLLPTTLVGSYTQPDWLVDREVLLGHGPPRVRMEQVWRVPAPQLDEAQDDATRLAVRDMEKAGLDIPTDGEIRRESYFNRFATALDGLSLDPPGEVLGRTGKPTLVPRVVGPIARPKPILLRDAAVLRQASEKPVRLTVPGPFTMTKLAKDESYGNDGELAMAYAAVVNQELLDLVAAGLDMVQLDEPYLQAHPDEGRAFGIAAINRALEGISVPKVLHLCFGYAYVVSGKPSGYSFLPELEQTGVDIVSIEAAEPKLDLAVLADLPSKMVMVGVLDLGDPEPETAEVVAGRIRAALDHLPAERLVVAPDCGMKYLPRETAFAKMRAMVEGARMVRRELEG